jgi:predicted phage terminase large subunit-like protein
MTNAEARAAEHLNRILTPTRMALYAGKEFMGRPYTIHPWIAHIERQIMEMLARPGREVLIISVPPQSGKTTFCGLFLPAWYLGLNPDNLVILVAYSDEYAQTWGMKTRSFMEAYGPALFDVHVSKNQASQNNWRTQRGFGGMLSAGINGGITGNPGHLIIIDDVVKNMQEALSAATKKMHIGEWDGSIQARFQEDTKVLITATRWAEDDLSGEILARASAVDYDGIPVTEIKIKAIAEPDEHDFLAMSDDQIDRWRDFLGRRMGEHLTGQHSAEFFAQKQRSISPYTWATLYQATPTVQKGSMFPRAAWGWYDPENRPRMTVQVRVWDLAATEGAGDYTVGALVGKDAEGLWYILDIRRVQHSGDRVMALVKDVAVADGWSVPIRLERERAGAGKSLIQLYTSELIGRDVEGVNAEGTKVSRFQPYSNFQQASKVLLPRFDDGTHPTWVAPFIDEHKQQMPDGRGPRHDDQIDAVAYAVLEMLDAGPVQLADPNDFGGIELESVEELAGRLGYTVVSR